MVNNETQNLSALFAALSDPTRRTMLQRLARSEMSVTELSRPFSLSKAAITKHLKVLERSGLLRRRVEGRIHFCQLNAAPLQPAANWLNFYERFWTRKLDSLQTFIEQVEDDV